MLNNAYSLWADWSTKKAKTGEQISPLTDLAIQSEEAGEKAPKKQEGLTHHTKGKQLSIRAQLVPQKGRQSKQTQPLREKRQEGGGYKQSTREI